MKFPHCVHLANTRWHFYTFQVAGIVSEADFVFIPEWPPEKNWPERLCKKLIESRDNGQRLNIM